MLDVHSTTKGFLAPRMTAAQKGLITSPATGLLIYQTDASAGFYYNNGTTVSPNWLQIPITFRSSTSACFIIKLKILSMPIC